jgi:hypothetical protein
MKTPKAICALVLAVVLFPAAGPRLRAAGGGSNYITIQKIEQFDQTSASGAVADPVAPFEFTSGCPVAMSFAPPGGMSTTLTTGAGRNGFGFSQTFGTQTAMDAAFPNGTYTLSVSGASNFTLSLAGNLYPNTPQVTNGTWNSSGQLVLDPTQNNTLNFAAFTAYGTTGVLSHMMISISSFDNSTVSLSQTNITPTNSSGFTSYSIPAGTLSPGSIYQCQLEYDTAAADNTTAISGDTAVTPCSASTSFTLVTSGAPSNASTITQQPTDQQAPVGSTVTFGISFNGGNNTEVEWFKNGIPVNQGNQNGPGLTLSNIQNSDAASYFAIITDGSGPYVQSSTVTLTIGTATATPPVITTQPYPQTISSGSTVVFHVIASGTPAPTYQWYFNGNVLSDGNGVSDSTGEALVINGATAASAGSYYCVVTNASGSVQSNSVALYVSTTSDIGRLVNISCRAQVGTGGNILIAGFAVGGAGTSGSESLLIRGSGPALLPFGVTGTLPDPQLQLYSGSTVLGTNDAWAGSAQISSTAASVGAFPWGSPSSHDAALLETLAAGPYTAQISGQSGDTGVALAEVYDATLPGSYTAATPRLVNISARVQVGTGGNVLIAGFVIGGSTSRTVLVRASGPALAPFGVSGTLPDPELQLFSGATLLGTNIAWGGKFEISNAASAVGAFAWSDPSSADSAILVTLPPGAYTAQVSGASNDTGVSLVEVYEVP